ncbi:unnamed protein product [Vicia faba]|uniref:MADS-box domain-containing protein n=1 Tax=Vicia faba TaxID=3906 RepID=A0AAV1AAQ3_VICFA|nr:unnamed protein product [Vicia faba]
MGRERISMELIPNSKSRKTTFEKRKNGLMKKVSELSILCDVDVCVILYAPNFEGEGFAEPETWPKDTNQVRRILQKYYNTAIDRRPKVYSVQEYFKERLKKVEFEISKVRKQRLKIMHRSCNQDYDSLRGNELKLLITTLDSRFASCCQKMDMLKGKAIVESQPSTSYLISNPSSYLNPFESKNSMPQAQIYPPLMNVSDKTPTFWSQPSSIIPSAQASCQPLQLGQSSQPSSIISSAQDFYQTLQLGQSVEPFSMIPCAQDFYQTLQLGQCSQPTSSAQDFYPSLQLGQSVEPLSMIPCAQESYQPLQLGQSVEPLSMIPLSMIPCAQASYPYEHIGANITYDHTKDNYGAGQNLSPYYYYKGNTSMQSYPPVNMQTLPFQNIPNLQEYGFQHYGITDMDVLQADMFNNMDERN